MRIDSVIVLIIICFGNTQLEAAINAFGETNPDNQAHSGQNLTLATSTIGIQRYGELRMNLGSQLTVTGAMWLGRDDAASAGIVTISGFDPNFGGLSTRLDVGAILTVGDLGFGRIDLSSSGVVTVNGRSILARQNVGAAVVTIAGLGTVWSEVNASPSNRMLIADQGNAFVSVTTGGLLKASHVVIGNESLGSGSLTVEGVGSRFNNFVGNNGELFVGGTPGGLLGGQGLMRLLASGKAFSREARVAADDFSTGRVEIDGSGSSWAVSGELYLGDLGTGSLSVTNSGSLLTQSNVFIGNDETSTGSVEIRGQGSLWNASLTGTNNQVNVGNNGYGSLGIYEGGQAVVVATSTGNSTSVAQTATSRGDIVVDGQGSRLLIDVSGSATTNDLNISNTTATGGGGLAEVTVSNNAFLHVKSGNINVAPLGTLALNNGRVQAGVLNAPQTLTNFGLVHGAGRIDATIINQLGGEIRMSAGQKLVAGFTVTNSGLIDVNGGELEVLGTTVNNGDIDVRNGIVRFRATAGGTGLTNNANSQLAITGDGNVDIYGTINNSVATSQIIVGANANAVFHDNVSNCGDVVIMPGSTALFLENLAMCPTARLVMNLAGTDLEDFGRIEVGGIANLAGTLAVGLSGGYAPQLGDTFQLITAATNMAGNFMTLNLPVLPPGMNWGVNTGPSGSSTAFFLSVIAGISPDFDGNGILNVMDLDMLTAAVAGNTGLSQFDLNGDGQLSLGDVSHWLASAGNVNLPSGNSYLFGDANLDGVVDGSDFGRWNANKFTFQSAWSKGDFNANGVIDGSDFGLWNANKFQSADTISAVPEPAGLACLLVGVYLIQRRRKA